MPFKPSAEDATSLFAIHWLANAIENLAIELYATDPSTFLESEKVLKACLKELTLQRNHISPGNGDDCPIGYELCDGICAPTCSGRGEFSARKKKGSKKKK